MYTRELCAFVQRTDYKDIPADVVSAAKRAILDNLAVTMSGSQEPSGKIICDMVKESGSPPEATVIGAHFKASAELAALANGTSAHTQDYDDCLDFPTAGLAHPTAGTFSGLLTMAEKHHRSGKDLILAYCLGVEAYGKTGLLVVQSGVGNRGWEWTGTLGVIGGTVGLSKMMKLDEEQTKNALGIASTMANSLIRNFGSFAGHLHGGNAARNAIESVKLAMKGYDSTGPDPMEGRGGYYNAFSGDLEPLDEKVQKERAATFGNPWNLVRPGLMFKYYPCAHISHFGAYAGQMLRKEHAFDWRDITDIEFRQPERLRRNSAPPDPETGVQGRFNMGYCLCRALIHGTIEPSFFTDEAVHDPDTRGLMKKLRWTVNPVEDVPGPFGHQEVVLTMKTGEKLSYRVDHPKGEPQNPQTPEELDAKFVKCAKYARYGEPVISRVRDMVANLDKVYDVSELTALLA
jgi:2-methylcitrate dehydratase PrpD